ncbi:MAG: hypothetical protein IPL61_10765 [Myxococcales bacterium]|nr:hypothetical protein [Myxococcales bacterium]
MSGCTSCGSKSGCDHRKGDMFAAIDDALAALYPDRRWRSPAGTAAPTEDAAALADELADVLHTATFVRGPATPGACTYVYVLCVGRPPCAIQVRDADLAIPDEWLAAPAAIQERYLRIALAPAVPFAVVQEVAVDVEVDRDGATVRERCLAGVYSAPLLQRFQRVVATLPAYDRRHLDMGELMGAPPGYDGGPWAQLYAGTPGVVNYLFFPEPASMTATTWIPREGA